MNAQEIIQKVCQFWNVTEEQLKHKTRKREIVIPRHVSMYLIKEYCDSSLISIGELFGGRDHTTVIHAVQTVKDIQDSDHNFRSRLSKLKSIISEKSELEENLDEQITLITEKVQQAS